MERNLQKVLSGYFIALLLISLVGFYPSYFSKFPYFDGFKPAFHFHALTALLWIFMLIAQAFLIRYKKYEWHRIIGKTSYLVMPLLLLSIFLVVRVVYFRNLEVMSVNDARARMTDGLPDIFYLGSMYLLAILFKKKTSWHLRFMTGTAYVLTGPGLGRLLFRNIDGAIAGPILGVFFLGLPLIWLLVDIIRKKSPIPVLYILATGILSVIIKNNGQTEWWQKFSKFIIDTFF